MNIVVGASSEYLSGALETSPSSRMLRVGGFGQLEFNDVLAWHNEIEIVVPPLSRTPRDFVPFGGISTGVRYSFLKDGLLSPILGLGFGFEPGTIISSTGDGQGTLSPKVYALFGAKKKIGIFSLYFVSSYSRYFYLVNATTSTDHFSISIGGQIDIFHFV